MLDKELLEILACPSCQGSLQEQADHLRCRQCGLRYPVKEGIPVLLVEEAEQSEQPGSDDTAKKEQA
ncbi:MAG: Trm112 family protein [Candidatus Omnitrophota bacterium]